MYEQYIGGGMKKTVERRQVVFFGAAVGPCGLPDDSTDPCDAESTNLRSVSVEKMHSCRKPRPTLWWLAE